MKSKIRYVCSSCGAISAKWQGRCTACDAWDSFVEEVESKQDKKHSRTKISEPTLISQYQSVNEKRLLTNISEFDRLIGGGIVSGSLILIGGDPGIGKSTLMLQICASLSDVKPIYISGEESPNQIKNRATRLNILDKNIYLLAETNFEAIVDVIKNSDSKFIVIDSIQSIYSDRIDSSPGNIIQIRECAFKLMELAKQSDKTIAIIGHINKEGSIAGPKVLEHLVDCVLQFEGEVDNVYRILRSHKNRFGSTNEIAIFEMKPNGLEEVSDPSTYLLTRRSGDEAGISIASILQGNRPLLIEVQSLTAPANYSLPQRVVTGYDIRRLNLILAVLEKKIGEKYGKEDVFLNFAGGLKVTDTSADLAVATSLSSSLNNYVVPDKTLFIGEIGLTGEVRAVSNLEQRVFDGIKSGIKKIIIPADNKIERQIPDGVEILKVDKLSTALSVY